MHARPSERSVATGGKPSQPGGPAKGPWGERFDLIDAWRGLAALAVVVHHVAFIYIGGPAVMLFFVISGYCIAASVDSCQRKGLGFGRFMMRRVRRIYPPYLLSVAFWAVTRAIKAAQGGHNDLVRDGPPLGFGVPLLNWQVNLSGTAVEWVQNVTLTQWLTLIGHPRPAAATNPTLFVAAYWSLCYEEQFYLLAGLMLLISQAVGLSIRGMVGVLIVAGLAWNVAFPEICYGHFLEYWAMFGMGAMVFYRLCRMSNPLHRRLVDASLVALLLVSAYMRWFAGVPWRVDAPGLAAVTREEFRLVYKELMIGAGFALLLIAMRPLNDTIRSKRLYLPFAALGHITVSLYLIHQFNLVFVRTVVEKPLSLLGLADPKLGAEHSPWYSLVLQILVHIAMASVFWYFCERPFLNKSLLPAAPPPSPGSSPAAPTPPDAAASSGPAQR